MPWGVWCLSLAPWGKMHFYSAQFLDLEAAQGQWDTAVKNEAARLLTLILLLTLQCWPKYLISLCINLCTHKIKLSFSAYVQGQVYELAETHTILNAMPGPLNPSLIRSHYKSYFYCRVFMFQNHGNERGKWACIAVNVVFALFPFLRSLSLDVTGKDFFGQWVSS